MLIPSRFYRRARQGATLRREGMHSVPGAILILARGADGLQQELTALKQEISEFEDRLRHVAEDWECRKSQIGIGHCPESP